MNSERLNRNLINFAKALTRFSEVLQEPESLIVLDATIQRFEFTYELMWKTLKNFLENIHGIRVISPRQVFKEAYALSFIESDELFLEMLHSRNLLSHTYNEKLANEIYHKCPSYLSAMQEVFKKLTEA